MTKKFRNWAEAVYHLQSSDIYPVPHVGGRTALVLHGYGHYAEFKSTLVFLYSKTIFHFSNEFIKSFPYPGFFYLPWSKYNIFPQFNNIQKNIPLFTEKKIYNYKLTVSCPEIAIFEMLSEIKDEFEFEECVNIIEGMAWINSDLLQNLLENCNNNRIKRLVLFLSKWASFDWYDNIKKDNIEYGDNIINVTDRGALEEEFKIIIPKVYAINEDKICIF